MKRKLSPAILSAERRVKEVLEDLSVNRVLCTYSKHALLNTCGVLKSGVRDVVFERPKYTVLVSGNVEIDVHS